MSYRKIASRDDGTCVHVKSDEGWTESEINQKGGGGGGHTRAADLIYSAIP
jgi:hypothetical protein